MAARVWGDYGDEARALVVTLAYTGLRPGELAALKRANLRLAAAELVVDATVDATGGEKPPKNGKPRVVTIPHVALRALASVPARVDSPYLFPHSAWPAEAASRRGVAREDRPPARRVRAAPCMCDAAARTRPESCRRGSAAWALRWGPARDTALRPSRRGPRPRPPQHGVRDGCGASESLPCAEWVARGSRTIAEMNCVQALSSFS